MPISHPPRDYEELIRVIHDRHDQMSKTYQRISVFLTQNPNDVAVQSVNAIAERCGIHASSFVRFAQALGYKGFKELQALFQQRLATAAPGFEARVKALEAELHTSRDRNETGFLSDLVVRDIASLHELLKDIRQEDLAAAARLLFEADTIYLVGQMRSLPVVELMRYQLTMVGKRCILLDSAGGLSTYVARTITPRDVLMAVSFRFYAKEVVNIAEELGAKGIDIVAISDSTLSPLAKSARVLFPVPEHDYTFSRSLAAPMCLAQALVVAVAARVQHDDKAPRIPIVTGT
ncbi:MurR/RpiR family transcriptional regulator [Paenirhodobacter sp.]|uniref:MurR/RpiR family transcriptional regulator n=1 Tax=Paenirhodobacter sp. TaxID=1965326 RepID=UPI003B413812